MNKDDINEIQENAWMTMDIFLDVIKDLDRHCNDKKIKRPILLFLDGFRGHLSLEISEYCQEKRIQLILFRQ